MGLNNTAAITLASIYAGERKAKSVLTIGKQEYLVTYLMDRMIKRKFHSPKTSKWKYADPYFRLLGANNIDSLDISDYQGAEIIHDLNLPIETPLHNKYDLVVDCGTIEHIADISQAVFNLMALVKPGGLLVFVSPGNNFFGHGCYQISPEFFLTHLTTANGYRIEKLMLSRNGYLYGKWWEIRDVERQGQRVMLKSRKLVFVICIARKVTTSVPVTAQQSDYIQLWKNASKTSTIGRIFLNLPLVFKDILGIWPLPQLQRRRAMRLLKSIPIKKGEFKFSGLGDNS